MPHARFNRPLMANKGGKVSDYINPKKNMKKSVKLIEDKKSEELKD